MNRCYHKYWDYNLKYHYRYCKYCSLMQYNYSGKWENELTLEQFCENWLPAVQSSNDFRVLLEIKIAFPFEFHCYETWGIAIQAKFTFPEINDRLKTPIHILNNMEFKYYTNLNELDWAIRQKYKELTGKDYEIGDNCYKEMRDIIQS